MATTEASDPLARRRLLRAGRRNQDDLQRLDPAPLVQLGERPICARAGELDEGQIESILDGPPVAQRLIEGGGAASDLLGIASQAIPRSCLANHAAGGG